MNTYYEEATNLARECLEYTFNTTYNAMCHIRTMGYDMDYDTWTATDTILGTKHNVLIGYNHELESIVIVVDHNNHDHIVDSISKNNIH